MIYLLIAVFLIIIILEVPGMLKKKLKRELIAFSVFLFIGFTLAFLQIIKVKIPSPNNLIKGIIEALTRGFS